MRAVLGIDANRPVIGALGRLVHKKGFCDLVDAIKLVRLSHPDILCVIGGQGDLAETLRAQARALGLEDRVLLPGAIPWEQAPDFYAMCDAVAVPSVVDRWGNVDGLPLVLLEAMSSGRPVIATAVAGNTDAVVDGVNGLLIPPAAPESLADALNRVLDDTELACELGENARRAAGLRYDWDVIVGEFEAIYSDALSTSSHERSGVSGEARPTGS